MPLIMRHKLMRKVHVGGSIHPLLQIASTAGTALLPRIGKQHIKKIMAGLMSAAVSAILAKSLEHGHRYMSNTISNKINQQGSPALNSLLGFTNTVLSDVLKPIDREMVPIKTQLEAQTAGQTNAPIKQMTKALQNLAMNTVAGNGVQPMGRGQRTKTGGMSLPPHINKALNSRADMLLRNILN